MQSTPIHIIKRNRRNAQRSTGPRTAKGKAISRANATTHGLTANPAAGVVEDRGAFERLHEALESRFCPRDVMEAGLVYRIAVCLWRLQRAAKIDGAVAGLQSMAVDSSRERVQHWVTQITQTFAAIDWVEVKDAELLRRRAVRNPATKGQPWFRAERRFLARADRYRDELLMSDGAAAQAMIQLIRQLADQLDHARWLDPMDAQMLAWLLGESAERLEEPDDAEDRKAIYYPDEKPFASLSDDLIGQARRRPRDSPMPGALRAVIHARLADLEVKSRAAQSPYTQEYEQLLKTEALLPDAATLDRLLRYEAHAERSMIRAIETLSRLRGVTVASVRATMSRSPHGEESLEVSGERTMWSGS